MRYGKETSDRIEKFAAEQAKEHLDYAELSYFEKFNVKGRKTKEKIINKLSKFKLSSEKVKEAENDLAEFTRDFVNDLMEKGFSEQEALAKAMETLKADASNGYTQELQEKYKNYFNMDDLHLYEAIGLYYAAFTVFGLVIGALAGIYAGLYVYTDNFWQAVIIPSCAGVLLGAALGMLKHASISMRMKK